MDDNLPKLFETGVADYFRDFGRRQARELPHQTWLLISVARHICPQLIVAELTLPNQDLAALGGLRKSSGAVNFDFAITRSEIDLRTWKRRTPGWKDGLATSTQSLQTLSEVAVLAEFKIANSTSTSSGSLAKDFKKLTGAIRFLEQHNCEAFPATYFVVLDPDRRLKLDCAVETAKDNWPPCAPFPTVLLGP